MNDTRLFYLTTETNVLYEAMEEVRRIQDPNKTTGEIVGMLSNMIQSRKLWIGEILKGGG